MNPAESDRNEECDYCACDDKGGSVVRKQTANSLDYLKHALNIKRPQRFCYGLNFYGSYRVLTDAPGRHFDAKALRQAQGPFAFIQNLSRNGLMTRDL